MYDNKTKAECLSLHPFQPRQARFLSRDSDYFCYSALLSRRPKRPGGCRTFVSPSAPTLQLKINSLPTISDLLYLLMSQVATKAVNQSRTKISQYAQMCLLNLFHIFWIILICDMKKKPYNFFNLESHKFPMMIMDMKPNSF